eukprot:326827-Pyramimonas_sp.AAC.1
MCHKSKPASLSWDVWRPARLHVVRKLFHDHGFQSSVQRLLHLSWLLAKDVAEYHATNWDASYVNREDCKRRRLALPIAPPIGARAWRDARRMLLCSCPSWEGA